MRIEFCATPYTFVDVPGFTTVWNAPQCRERGVYLWCLEQQGAYLINYVGMTAGRDGFTGRLWTELRDWRAGWYAAGVDLERFTAGQRVVLPDCSPDVINAQRIALEPLYRIFLSSIPDPTTTRQVESFIVYSLMQHPYTAQYLGNKKPERYKRPPIEFEIASAAPLIGLTAAIPVVT